MKNRKAGRSAPESVAPEAAPVDATPTVITLKPKRQVTRYTVAYKGVTYDSPRKALDAAGLAGYKGSQVRTVLKGAAVGTKLVIEGHEFTYQGAPVK
jgi:pectin methylesterase-like acyl-CoA thioesterase